jgi:hypothetical protein
MIHSTLRHPNGVAGDSHPSKSGVTFAPNPAGKETEKNDEEMTTTTASTYHSSRSFHVNSQDGTFRLTMIWKVQDMTINTIDSANQTFTNLLNDFMGYDDFTVHPWLSSNPHKQSLVTKVNIGQKNILEYASDKVLSIAEKRLYIVTLRVSIASQVSNFLRRFKSILDHYYISIRVSNASPDAGPVSFAGEILYKHPRHTHRLRYAQHLRSLLPEDCPPFDIEHQSGRNNEPARLKVNCGRNHIEQLGKLLCGILTGPTATSNQAFFLSRMQSSKMSRQEVDKLYSRHATYLRGSATIPVPLYSNLDVPRTETCPDGSTQVRSLRTWVSQLKLSNGHLAYCDIDKGSGNVVIICPQVHREYVQQALGKYCDNLRNSHAFPQWKNPIPDSIFLKEVLSESPTTNVPNPWAHATETSQPVQARPSPVPNVHSHPDQFPPLHNSTPSSPQSTLTSPTEISTMKTEMTAMQAEILSLKDILQDIKDTLSTQAQPAPPTSQPPSITDNVLSTIATRQTNLEQSTNAEIHRLRLEFNNVALDLRQSLREDMKEMFCAFAPQSLAINSPAHKRTRTTDPDGFTKASDLLPPHPNESFDEDEHMSQATDLLPPSPPTSPSSPLSSLPPPASQNTHSPGSEEASP